MKKADYEQGLEEKRQGLEKLLQRRSDLDRRIAKLRQEIGSLAYLAGQTSSFLQLVHSIKAEVVQGSKLGLKYSVREVLRAADEPLTPQEVLDGIERLGRTGDHANNLASAYTTLKRMDEKKEVVPSIKNGKKAYKLKS